MLKQVVKFPGSTIAGVDPLAQTFFVTEPTVVTKVDLYFFTKDTAVPMRVDIRKVVNGIPSKDIVPFSIKSVPAASVQTSTRGDVATTVTFESPVYLDAGEYALVLMSDSTKYRVWISQLGDFDILTDRYVNAQPYIGVLFKSQNASTWTPDQLQDLKFTLYKAVFNANASATVDMIPSDDTVYENVLGENAFEVFPNSSTMRVYFPRHGLTNGSYITLEDFDDDLVTNYGDNVNSNIFGIDIDQLEEQRFLVSNVTSNWFTIDLPAAVDGTVTSALRFEDEPVVDSDIRFEKLNPMVAVLNLPGTTVSESVRATTVGYSVDSSYTSVPLTGLSFNTPKIIASTTNAEENLANNQSLIYRVTLGTSNPNLSPFLDLKKSGVALTRYLLDNPTYSTVNLSYDITTLANTNTISFTNLTNTTGTINFTDSLDKVNVAAVVKGTTVTITGSANNTGTFRVLDVLDSGSNLVLVGNVITEAANASGRVAITNGKEYVAEEAAFDGTVTSKYITRQVNFVNPSTSINLRFDACMPNESQIKVYYKVKLVGETTPLTEKEFTELTNITIPTSQAGEFYEVEKQLDSLPQFDSLILKIVFVSDNAAKVPKVKSLRLVVLA